MDDQVSGRPVDIVLLDIDGVLTDGTVTIGSDGAESKRIAFDDIDGVFRLKRAGLKVGFITGESSPFCDYVARRFTPDFFVRACKDKVAAFEKIVAESGVGPDRVAFVGDSMHDVPLLRRIRHSFAPADAAGAVRAAVSVVLAARRGHGAVLEVAERLAEGGASAAAAEWRDAVNALSTRSADVRLLEAIGRAKAMIGLASGKAVVLELSGGHTEAGRKEQRAAREKGLRVICVSGAAPADESTCEADVCVRAVAGHEPLGSLERAFITRYVWPDADHSSPDAAR